MPGLDRAHGEADQRLGGRAAAHHVHVEVEPDAEVGRDPVGRRRVAVLIAHHAVDVGRAAGRRRGSRCGWRRPPSRGSCAPSCASTRSRPRRRCSTCREAYSSDLLTARRPLPCCPPEPVLDPNAGPPEPWRSHIQQVFTGASPGPDQARATFTRSVCGRSRGHEESSAGRGRRAAERQEDDRQRAERSGAKAGV